MSQPPAYNREHDFDADEPDNTDGQAINDELDRASQSINAIRDNLAKIQRDDGGLANGIVTEDSLAPALKADLFNTFSQDINDKVLEAAQAANDATNAALAAGQSASNAASARDAAAGAANTAVASAQAAGASQNAAAGSATAAAASATAANTSATSAGASAVSAQGDAQSANAAAATANTAAASALQARDDAQAAAAAAESFEALSAQMSAEAASSAGLARAWAAQESGTVADGLLSARQYAELAAAGAGLPVYSTIPATDEGPIWVIGMGPMEWNVSASLYLPVVRFAECRLDGGTVANSIWFHRAGGHRLTAGNETLIIPEAGIQLVPSGLSLGTLYNVFGYSNDGLLAIEYGTGAAWGHAADPETGVHVKFNTSTNTYERSRTFLGMFFNNGVGQILDTGAQRGVASWYNRMPKTATSSNASMSTSSTTFIQGAAVAGLTWAGASLTASFSSFALSSAASYGMNRACLGSNNGPIVPISADAQSVIADHYVQLAQSTTVATATDQMFTLQYLLATGTAGAASTHSGYVNLVTWI